MNEWVAVVFSKDRPLQLDLTLRSLYSRCKDIDDLAVVVLYTTSDERYLDAYRTLISEHPDVIFIKESGFKKYLVTILSDKTHVLFVVDDCIFIRDFSFSTAVDMLETSEKLIGVSLRVSPDTNWCYPINRSQQFPTVSYTWKPSTDLISYDWTKAEFDFEYPLEVSSSIYKMNTIRLIIDQTNYTHPNSLESIMAHQSRYYATSHPMLGCFKHSVAFCAPMNKVQSTHNNRSSGVSQFSPEKLLTIFEKGVRIDSEKFIGMKVNSPHMEIDFLELTKE